MLESEMNNVLSPDPNYLDQIFCGRKKGKKSPSWVTSILKANESYIKSMMGVYTFRDDKY